MDKRFRNFLKHILEIHTNNCINFKGDLDGVEEFTIKEIEKIYRDVDKRVKREKRDAKARI